MDKRGSRRSSEYPVFERLELRMLLSNAPPIIAVDTVWDDTSEPYWLVSDVTVQAGATLTIRPGGLINRKMANASVDFPDPDSPTRPSFSPGLS